MTEAAAARARFCAELAARYALFLLYRDGAIDGASAEGCNLWTLLQEGLGDHDDAPQVPLDEVVGRVEEQMAAVHP